MKTHVGSSSHSVFADLFCIRLKSWNWSLFTLRSTSGALSKQTWRDCSRVGTFFNIVSIGVDASPKKRKNNRNGTCREWLILYPLVSLPASALFVSPSVLIYFICSSYCEREFRDCRLQTCYVQSPAYPGLYPRALKCRYRLHTRQPFIKLYLQNEQFAIDGQR